MVKNSPRILIVEDEALLALELSQQLVKAGYVVAGTATTGADAIRLAAAEQPDLVLMDIKLPGDMDGIAAAEQIRARADIPIVYLTISTDAEVVARAKTTSPFGYLVKPVQTSQLQVAITMALHQHALEREVRETHQHLAQAAQRLREQEEKYRALFESFPLGITISDAAGRVVEANVMTEKLLGLSAATHTQRTIDGPEWQIVRLDGTPMPPEEYASVRALRENRLIENIKMGIVKSDHEITWINVTAAPIPLENYGVAITYGDITEQKRAEDALRESENRYRELFEHINSGVAVYEVKNDGQDFIFKDFNRAAEQIDHDQRERLIGKSIFEVRPGVEEFGLIDIFRKVWRTGEAAHHPITRYQDDRLSGWYENFVYKLPSGDIIAVFDDITERKQAEEALRQSEERYRRITAAVTDYIYTVRVKEGQAVETIHGPACVAVTGYTSEEFRTNPYLWLEMAHPDDRSAIQAYAASILAGSKTDPLEHRILRKDGALRWVRNTAVPHYDAEGRLISYDGLVRDITDRRKAENALKESEERFRQLIENIEEVFWIRDLQTRQLIYMSPSYEKVWGRSIQGKYQRSGDFLDAVHPEDLAAVKAAYRQSTARPISIEHRIVRPDGDMRWIWVQTFCLRNDAGEAVRQIGIAADITDRKESETELSNYREHLEDLVADRTRELQQANRQLAREIEERTRIEKELQSAKEAAERANREKSTFLANMSHDIRTPLNAILGFTEILKEKLENTPEYQSYLTRIATGGTSLLRLINDVLDLSKIEAGQIDSQIETVNLPVLLMEMEHLFALKAQEKGIQFVTSIDATLPAAVLLDGAHLHQILINLIGNAIKFTKQGNVTLKIENLERNAPPSSMFNLQFSISDTGIGIASDELDRIFDPFYQATRHFGGTGLGLAISKRLTELMHGSLTIESTVNQGSTFSVIFPEVVAATMEPPHPAATPHQNQAFRFDNVTLLLVEDNASNREIIRSYLAKQPFQIMEAENGQAALDLFNERRPDLILMDIQMPVMDGYEAARRIRQGEGSRQKAEGSQSHIPILALTAYALKEQREQLQDVFDGYLTKPIDKATLLAALARFLPHTLVNEPSVQRTASGSPEAESHEQQQFLDEIQRYLPVGQALRDRMDNNLIPQYEMCRAIMSIDELLEFAEAIIATGNEFQIPPLTSYGEQLAASIKIFQIQGVKRLLALFPEVAVMLG